MKAILSDFDGTLYFGKDKDYSPVIAAIKKWQAAGNLFCMATGRSLSHLMGDLAPLNIPVDYYVLSTGAAIYDKDRNPVDIKFISGKDVEKICALAEDLDYIYYGAQKDGEYYNHRKEDPVEIPFDRDYIAAYAHFANMETADIFEKRLKEELGERVRGVRQTVFFDLPHISCGKANGIRRFIELLNIKYEDAYCIGDGLNDLDMLSAFQSFSLHHACKEAKETAARLVTDIPEMIDILLAEQ